VPGGDSDQDVRLQPRVALVQLPKLPEVNLELVGSFGESRAFRQGGVATMRTPEAEETLVATRNDVCPVPERQSAELLLDERNVIRIVGTDQKMQVDARSLLGLYCQAQLDVGEDQRNARQSTLVPPLQDLLVG